MARDSLWRLVRDIVGGDPIRAQHDQLDRLVGYQARRVAESDYHAHMIEHYRVRLTAIDPFTDWWSYARCRQAMYDHEIERDVELDRAAQLSARVSETHEKLIELLGR